MSRRHAFAPTHLRTVVGAGISRGLTLVSYLCIGLRLTGDSDSGLSRTAGRSTGDRTRPIGYYRHGQTGHCERCDRVNGRSSGIGDGGHVDQNRVCPIWIYPVGRAGDRERNLLRRNGFRRFGLVVRRRAATRES